jgi:hypothetical protein
MTTSLLGFMGSGTLKNPTHWNLLEGGNTRLLGFWGWGNTTQPRGRLLPSGQFGGDDLGTCLLVEYPKIESSESDYSASPQNHVVKGDIAWLVFSLTTHSACTPSFLNAPFRAMFYRKDTRSLVNFEFLPGSSNTLVQWFTRDGSLQTPLRKSWAVESAPPPEKG